MAGKLDRRLSLLFSMTPSCEAAADVGTDHGYLICALVSSGRVKRGVATDINPMPLEKARQEAKRQGLCQKISLVLGDGLAGVSPQGLGAVIAAGMGGETIAHILESWPHSRTPGITWLLQPMTKAQRLRDWLWENGYEIRREECCTQGGKTYSVLEAVFTGAITQHEPWERWLGKVDPRRDESSRRYAKNRVRELESAAAGLMEGGGEEGARRLLACAEAIKRKLEEP